MFNIGPQELLLIIVIALVVVGPKKLPELGRTLGKGLREVRKAQDEVRRTVKETIAEEERPTFRTVPTPRSAEIAEPTSAPGDETTEGEANTDAAPPSDPSDVREISRTLGQSLSELRRAREDIRRSLRVDPERPSPPAARRRRRPRSPTETPPVGVESPPEGAESPTGSPEE